MARKTVVIAGAGSGGMAAGIRLREILPGNEYRIIMLDQERTHTYWASFPLVVAGMREAEDICRPLVDLERHNVEFVQARIERITLEKQRIDTDAGELAYDYLVVGLGARYDYERIPGYARHAYGFYDLSQALCLRAALASFTGGTVTLFIGSTPFKCEAAPSEMMMLLDDYFRRRSLREAVDLQMLTPESRLACSLQPAIGSELERLLIHRGIHVRTDAKVVEVGRDYLRLTSGEHIVSDLSIGVPPHSGQRAVHTGGLSNREGWIEVDRPTMATSQPGVWAVGDITKIPLPTGKGWVPKSASLAKLQGNVVAEQLRSALTGRRPTGYFRARSACVALVDHKRGVHITTDFNSPLPGVIYSPSRLWQVEKLAVEHWWLHRWF